MSNTKTLVMKRLIPILAVTILLLVSSSDSPDEFQIFNFNYENVLGTSFALKLAASSRENAIEAEKAVLNEIDRLAGLLSAYDTESEFSQWQKTYNKDIPLSSELFEVLSLFDQWRSKTGGVLNPAAAVAIGLWSKAELENKLPEKEEISDAVSAMGKDHWILDYEKQTARHISTETLVLNTFVKSYIISKASEVVMDIPGVRSSLINIGGDIVVSGEMEERVNIADPLAPSENDHPVSTIKVDNKAVATSGNYRRGFMIENEWYSHIIDTRTAMPAREIISATVVANNAAQAGALATTFNILSPEESIILASQMPDVDYLIITQTGQHIESDGWKKLEIQRFTNAANDPGDEGKNLNLSETEFELLIDIELAKFEGRYLRPYLAVWIEDDKGEPVRTLALWFNNYRWLPDLRRWYTKNYTKTQNSEFMQSVTSATRPAGKYSFRWDGIDDQGNSRKPGKYMVYIEVVREHGTYQLIKQPVEINYTPQRFELPPGTEVSSAVIVYSKVEKMNASN